MGVRPRPEIRGACFVVRKRRSAHARSPAGRKGSSICDPHPLPRSPPRHGPKRPPVTTPRLTALSSRDGARGQHRTSSGPVAAVHPSARGGGRAPRRNSARASSRRSMGARAACAISTPPRARGSTTSAPASVSTVRPSRAIRLPTGSGSRVAGQGFDRVPFHGRRNLDPLVPLPDAIYRRFIRARGVLIFGRGTFQEFHVACRHIDPGCRGDPTIAT